MSQSYGGKCFGGPYAGKEVAYPEKTMPVIWLEGSLLLLLSFKREGAYEFGDDGIWLWCGPTFKKQSS